MNHKHRYSLVRILVSIALVILLQLLPLSGLPRLAAFVLVYLFVGYDVLWRAVRGILQGEFFDENLLMMIATLGAFGLALYEGSGDYMEAISVLLLYQIGEFFQDYAVRRSRRAIAAHMGAVPEGVTRHTSQSEDFISRLARVYTPVVCACALALLVIPPFWQVAFGGAEWGFGVFDVWIYRALTFLVISCPCALVISIPLAFFAGIGCASREGILVRDAGSLEALARLRPEDAHDAASLQRLGVVLTGDNPQQPQRALAIAQHCLRIVWQNIVMTFGIKLLCLVLGAIGITGMWLAVLADVGVMILAVLNALRALYLR